MVFVPALAASAGVVAADGAGVEAAVVAPIGIGVGVDVAAVPVTPAAKANALDDVSEVRGVAETEADAEAALGAAIVTGG